MPPSRGPSLALGAWPPKLPGQGEKGFILPSVFEVGLWGFGQRDLGSNAVSATYRLCLGQIISAFCHL